MKRIATQPRANWRQEVEESGLKHSPDLWNESAFYQFSPDEVNEIRLATNELHALTLNAVQHVIDNRLYSELGIPTEWTELIERSWKRKDQHILGRLDLAYNGKEPPKLIEYNGDNASMIVESAWIQEQWLLGKFGDKPVEQFADTHELLIKRWGSTYTNAHVHFSCHPLDKEALSQVIYMRDIANAAGCTSTDVAVTDIGWDRAKGCFVDMDEKKIVSMYKTYPWDWLLREDFGKHLFADPLHMIEPAWKIIMTSKGLLKILWKLFPNHPNLLPTYENFVLCGDGFVKKPLFGREGLNIEIHHGTKTERTGGTKESTEYVYQSIAPIPEFDGFYPIVSTFVVGHDAAGIGIREDRDMITSKSAKFVPHVIYAEENGALQ